MDYSKLVESLRKTESNRKCFDCGVVGTTYASLNFGTFVCSQCAGILRGLNFKVKPLGISIFTLNEYEILHKNGNDNAKNIWMALYDPYKHEKPNPKNYNDVKEHLIRKYKEKKFFRESKGIHFINKSIEEDIKDPLEFINKCKIKNIDVGPLWTKKKSEQKNDDFWNDNNDKKSENINENKNQNNNFDLLGGLFGMDNSNNQNENNNNNKTSDVNDLLGGFNFNNDNKTGKFNNMINNLNNAQPIFNNNKDNKENDFGFDFSSFNQGNNNINKQNQPTPKKKEEIQDENFGFDFGDENQDNNNNNKQIKTNDNIDKVTNNEGASNLLYFDFNNNMNNQNKNNNLDIFNNDKKEQKNILEFDFGDNNNQNQNNQNNKQENIVNNDLGFEFDSQTQQQKDETKQVINENNNNNDDLGLNFDFSNIKSDQTINEPKNINNIFDDPNTEKINDMKKNQEMKRNDNFQNLTIALDNQNQFDKINQANFDFGSNNFFSKDNNKQKENTDFNFEQMMNLKK